VGWAAQFAFTANGSSPIPAVSFFSLLIDVGMAARLSKALLETRIDNLAQVFDRRLFPFWHGKCGAAEFE
jgi:hypothetical protein